MTSKRNGVGSDQRLQSHRAPDVFHSMADQIQPRPSLGHSPNAYPCNWSAPSQLPSMNGQHYSGNSHQLPSLPIHLPRMENGAFFGSQLCGHLGHSPIGSNFATQNSPPITVYGALTNSVNYPPIQAYPGHHPSINPSSQVQHSFQINIEYSEDNNPIFGVRPGAFHGHSRAPSFESLGPSPSPSDDGAASAQGSSGSASDGPNHKPGSFPCSSCPKVFPRRARAEACENRHVGAQPYQCDGACGNDNCTSRFSAKASYQRHCRPEEQRYAQCGICEERILKQNIARHMRQHPS